MLGIDGRFHGVRWRDWQPSRVYQQPFVLWSLLLLVLLFIVKVLKTVHGRWKESLFWCEKELWNVWIGFWNTHFFQDVFKMRGFKINNSYSRINLSFQISCSTKIFEILSYLISGVMISDSMTLFDNHFWQAWWNFMRSQLYFHTRKYLVTAGPRG